MSLQKDNSSDESLQGKVNTTKPAWRLAQQSVLMLALAEFSKQEVHNVKLANIAWAEQSWY